MTPGQGFPGWFVALFLLVALIGVASVIWRISVARKVAKDAGLDPNTATAVTLLSNDGVDAAYLASTLTSSPRPQSADQTQPSKSAEERLLELQALKNKGLITQDEYDTRRREILGSI